MKARVNKMLFRKTSKCHKAMTLHILREKQCFVQEFEDVNIRVASTDQTNKDMLYGATI